MKYGLVMLLVAMTTPAAGNDLRGGNDLLGYAIPVDRPSVAVEEWEVGAELPIAPTVDEPTLAIEIAAPS